MVGYALVVLAAAAVGGFVLFTGHLRRGEFSLALGVLHAQGALAGFGLLLIWYLGA